MVWSKSRSFDSGVLLLEYCKWEKIKTFQLGSLGKINCDFCKHQLISKSFQGIRVSFSFTQGIKFSCRYYWFCPEVFIRIQEWWVLVKKTKDCKRNSYLRCKFITTLQKSRNLFWEFMAKIRLSESIKGLLQILLIWLSSFNLGISLKF